MRRYIEGNLTGFSKIPPIPGTVCGGKTCCEAGDVFLPFGSPEMVGLGFSVLCMLVFIELFGSPFMKNCNVVIALLFGGVLQVGTWKKL